MMEKDKDIWVGFIQSIPNENSWTPTGLIINAHTLNHYCGEAFCRLISPFSSLGPTPRLHAVKTGATPLGGARCLRREHREAHLHTGLLVIAKFLHPTHHCGPED